MSAGTIAAAVAAVALALIAQADRPALVGFGCEGAAGPIYADAEDDFPPCERIERN